MFYVYHLILLTVALRTGKVLAGGTKLDRREFNIRNYNGA